MHLKYIKICVTKKIVRLWQIQEISASFPVMPSLVQNLHGFSNISRNYVITWLQLSETLLEGIVCYAGQLLASQENKKNLKIEKFWILFKILNNLFFLFCHLKKKSWVIKYKNSLLLVLLFNEITHPPGVSSHPLFHP